MDHICGENEQLKQLISHIIDSGYMPDTRVEDTLLGIFVPLYPLHVKITLHGTIVHRALLAHVF